MAARAARFRFHGALADHLPRERRGVWFEIPFHGAPSLKDAIEALGPPHPEVDLIVVDGAPASFEAHLADGARVEVFPLGEGPEVAPSARLAPRALPMPRFVLDGHLGALAALLRMLGIDVVWERDAEDEDLARQSASEDRTLLSRDRGLLKRGIVRRGWFVRARYPMEQGREIVERFELWAHARPFSRCLRCNALLGEATPEQVAALPARVRERHREFRACPACGRVYWSGTHHARMNERVATLLSAQNATSIPVV